MNSCLLFFGLVDFFFGGGIPPEKPRINTDQSGGSGDGSFPSGVQGQSPGSGKGSGGRSRPEAEAFCPFAHNILLAVVKRTNKQTNTQTDNTLRSLAHSVTNRKMSQLQMV